MKKITLTLSIILLSYFGYGQHLHQYYTVFKRSVNYQHITGGNEFFGNEDHDDYTLFDRSIGFAFNYNGQTHYYVNVSTNGALRFGSQQSVDYTNQLESTTCTDVIAPLWDDLYIRAADHGKIIYKLEGTTPYRRFIVEWRDISWRNQGSTVSFKIILYETTNNIEFQYGPANLTDTNRSASIGLSQGTSGTEFMSITPTADYMTVNAATADNTINTNQYPGNGTAFAFKHLTYVPDDNLEQAMIDEGWDTTLDDYVETQQIRSATYFGPTNRNISDATGVEDMQMLTFFQVGQNNLTTLTNLDNRHLTYLGCESNQITQIDVTRLPALEKLEAPWNDISQIDVTHNPNLEYLHIFNNHISQIDLTQNPNLNDLNIEDNELTSIDLSQNPDMIYLRVGGNQLSALDVTNMPNLLDLYCAFNQIGTLDLTHNPQLRDVFAHHNLFEQIDLRETTNAVGVVGLQRVLLNNNPNLKRVLLDNQHNDNLTDVDITTCPQLYCVSVDDEAAANAGTGVYADWDIDPHGSYAGPGGCPERTHIPDPNFEAYLEAHNMGDGIPNNHYVLTDNISGVQSLNIGNQNIADLTGIEDFASLITLYCQQNQLTQLNVSQNTNLQNLYCFQNPLTSLTTGGATNLRSLNADQTQLSYVDLSQNQMLRNLHLSQTNMQYLDLRNHPALLTVYCYDALLTQVELNNAPNLKWLYLRNNQLTNIDMDNNPLLERVDLRNNHLGELHIQNGANNLLAGTYTVSGISYARFRATGNPNLTCVFVDDATAANNGTGDYADWEIDATATYVQNTTQCNNVVNPTTYVPDIYFEHYLETHTASGATVAIGDANSMGNGTDGDHYVLTARIENVTNLNVSNKNIADLTGIEDFAALQQLFCSHNQLTNLDVSQNTNLQTLSASYNNLSILDVSQNTNLTTLYATSNNLTTLHLSNSITVLRCGNNQLTALDVSGLTQLTNLSCNDNQLTALDVTGNHALTQINCSNNQLTGLDLSNQQDIADIACSNNQITELLISEGYYGQSDLMYLFCDHNQLTALDLSGFETLEEIECQYNQLEGLNVANGNYNNFGNLNFTNNPNLTCVEVDDVNYMDTHWASAKDAGASYSTACHYNETYVPDDNFEHYLETHDANGNTVPVGAGNSLGNGTDGDDYVSTSKIEAVTSLDVHGQNIVDLTGIEDFTNLRSLLVYNNNLTSLDVHHNHYLQYLYCHQNQLTNLNVFRMRYLEVIWAHLNQLTSFDAAQLPNLKSLYIGNNQLTSLDVSNNPALETLYCYSNHLTSLDVSQNSNLKKLWTHYNQLTSLNVDNNPLLEQLWVYNNNLTELHIQNGANNLLSGTFTVGSNTYIRMKAANNPDLTCIYVDNVTAANNGTGDYQDWEKDDHANYVADATECANLSRQTYVPDDNFEAYLEAHNMGDGIANNNYVYTANIENVITLDVSNKNISDLTGIEDFAALTTLSCYRNQLTSLNISQNSSLTKISCSHNLLTTLDVSQNSNLSWLYCHNNPLTALDVSNNSVLTRLDCSYCQIDVLDLSQNSHLSHIFLNNNQLTSLNVQNGNNTLVAAFDATNNPNLTCIQVDDAAWSTTNWAQIDPTASFSTDCSIVYYSLTVNTSGNGSVSPSSGTYADGTVVTLTATPDAGWEFAGWSGDLSGSTNPATITMDADKTVTATFTRIQHTLTVNTTGNGSVSLNPAGGTYDEGTTVTLTATPSAGWEFAGWSGDLSSMTNPATITMDADKTVTATFTRIQHTLTVNTTGNGSVNLNPAGGTYDEGTTVTLTATPDAGWQFAGWSGDLSGMTNPATITMDADKTVTATFTRIQHTLTVNTTGNGSVSLNPAGGTYNEGTTVTLTATPSAGWEFAGWSGDLSGMTNPATMTMDADKTVTATFTRIQHTLTVNTTGNGSVNLNPAGGTYADGTVVTLTATPDAGWEFAGWSGDLSGMINPATITMDADKTVTATFTRIQHTLTVNTTGNGSVSLSPAGGTYNEGTTVTLTATPSAGWEFAGWSGDLSGSTNPASITMDADKTVTATFNQLAQTYVPDDNFEHYLEHHDADGNVVTLGASNSMGNGVENDDYVLTSRISTVTHLSIHNQNIADLTGIQDFTALTNIACNGNNLSSVDFSQNTNLTYIDMGYNQIGSIDLSSNMALEILSASFNQLTDLDISMLSNFISLDVSHNHLTSLNVKNGNNTNFSRFIATNNPNLTCIFVDDPAWSDTHWTNIDPTSHFVANQTECDNLGINDETLRSALKVFPNPVNDHLTIQSGTYQDMAISVYNLIGQKLIDQKSNNGQSTVNLKSLPAATYVVKITIDGRSIYYNIVKE